MPHRRLILLMAAVLLGGVAFGTWKLGQRVLNPPGPSVVDPAVLHERWVEGTRSAIAAFERDQDAAKARDNLLGLRVNAADRAVHQELVFAFEALASQAEGGEERVRAAQERFLTHTK